MQEYRITWQVCPHIHHPIRVMFVEAVSPEAAKALAKDVIERNTGLEWFTIHTAEAYERPTDARLIRG
jgi:hypothetical protein